LLLYIEGTQEELERVEALDPEEYKEFKISI